MQPLSKLLEINNKRPLLPLKNEATVTLTLKLLSYKVSARFNRSVEGSINGLGAKTIVTALRKINNGTQVYDHVTQQHAMP